MRAGGLRGRRERRQGRGALRSRLQRDPGLRSCPRCDTAIHMRRATRDARGSERTAQCAQTLCMQQKAQDTMFSDQAGNTPRTRSFYCNVRQAAITFESKELS